VKKIICIPENNQEASQQKQSVLHTSFGVTGYFPIDEKDSIERLQNIAVKI